MVEQIMIKNILFDMDGVLIDAQDWHYNALNRALEKFGMDINREAHLTTYDGLTTRTKLSMLSKAHGLPEELHEFLNALKQRYTIELSQAHCKPVFHHQYALNLLKRDNYKLGVCSNSVKNSVHTMMNLSCLSEYLDIQVSNEDVTNPKPDPEMYLKAMSVLKANPAETMIVEDNDHGIQAAKASKAHVMVVNSTDEVNYDNIMMHIQMFEKTNKDQL